MGRNGTRDIIERRYAYIALFEVRFVDYRLCDPRVFEYMLPQVCVHLEDGIGGLGF